MRGGSAAGGIYNEGVGVGGPLDDEFSDGVAGVEVSVVCSSRVDHQNGKQVN
jgi:hypothetical protein